MTASVPYTPQVADPATVVERRAADWISSYTQAEHLRRTRDWLVYLAPAASPEMRIAALTHDIERMYSGGPAVAHGASWDDPFYLYPHMLRSAEFVGVWLTNLGTASATVDIAEIRRLVGLHEVGGRDGADDVQAADSLSFLETLAGLTSEWVRNGTCSREHAANKLRYMAHRVRLSAARAYAAPLLQAALAQLPRPRSRSTP